VKTDKASKMNRGLCKSMRANAINQIDWANRSFNNLPNKKKKVVILLFGVCVTGISGMLIIQALRNQENQVQFKPERIVTPYDIFMKDETSVSEGQLTPVGKMKGEIDGEFESFYVAVDSKGSIYVNRNIEYAESAYDLTDAWKQISREKLMEYEKELHFLPSRTRGLRR
jgi:hypothetical protein